MLFFKYYYAVNLCMSEQVIHVPGRELLQLCLVADWVQMSFAQWLELLREEMEVCFLLCHCISACMAMDGLGQCLCSSVYSDARHRGTITETPLKLSFRITWRDSL